MSAKKPIPPPPEEPGVEPDARPHRRFTAADAVYRENADLLKGTSPVTRKRQAEAELEDLLERTLDDAEGALGPVLLRRVTDGESLLELGYENPPAALAAVIEEILRSADRLRRFVRAVDAEWGRIYLERPHFDRPGEPPDSEDPYTEESVRARLEALLERLRGSGENE